MLLNLFTGDFLKTYNKQVSHANHKGFEALSGSKTDKTHCDDDLTCEETDEGECYWEPDVDGDGFYFCTEEVCDVIGQDLGCDDEEFNTAHRMPET